MIDVILILCPLPLNLHLDHQDPLDLGSVDLWHYLVECVNNPQFVNQNLSTHLVQHRIDLYKPCLLNILLLIEV